jgi:hypothetical protein
MTVYLWHFVPVIIVAAAFYPTGVMPQPAVGTPQWVGTAPGLVRHTHRGARAAGGGRHAAERPMSRLPAGIGPPGAWSPALLLAGLASSMFGLARLAIAGFAPGGNLAGELRHLIRQRQAAAPTADELRVEYASLLGWTGGLVIEMLRQIEVADEKVARSSHRTQPVAGQ